MIDKKELLEIVDACFHFFASDYRIDAKEMASEIYDAEEKEEQMIDKKRKITIAEGMELSQGLDGHWLTVTADGFHASLNLENMKGIVRTAFLTWAEKTWREADGTGKEAIQGEPV